MKKITINFSAFVYFVFFLSEKWQCARSVLQSGSVLNPGGDRQKYEGQMNKGTNGRANGLSCVEYRIVAFL